MWKPCLEFPQTVIKEGKDLMKPKKCRRIVNGIAFVVLGIVFLSNLPYFTSIRTEMIAGAMILIVSDLVFGLIFLRCPYCKRLLNFRWSSQSICHNCGRKLDEDN